ncbi:MAG TPA: acyl-ACP--UDP-N-acetylglucosamine O-acyltransferase [Chthonomonadaceae bacterium]|nr:acyl-ACP--UDP-N-acetylglucosamine O-acyltransferase [Chthonomonadaceae bacterium]
MITVAELRIHPSAVIHTSADIDSTVEIGPFCFVGENVTLGPGTRVHAGAHILKNTRIGRNCHVFTGAVIGGPPQDHKYRNEETYVEIGDENILRECVTIHRATGEGQVTRIGNGNMVMAYAHIGHNCHIGDRVTIASYVGISGHVTVEDGVNFGGSSGVHQFCRIGTLAMVGGMSGINKDVPPYMTATGLPAQVIDVNVRGLRRAGVPAKTRGDVRSAYKLLYRSNLNQSQALEAIEEEIDSSPELEHLLDFIRNTRAGTNGRGNTA